jgi:hypothetical protein
VTGCGVWIAFGVSAGTCAGTSAGIRGGGSVSTASGAAAFGGLQRGHSSYAGGTSPPHVGQIHVNMRPYGTAGAAS